jgi:aspartate kinase
MIDLHSKDFSFVGEQHVATLYQLFGKLKIKPNLTQNAAISFVSIFDDHAEKIEKLALEASDIFDVRVIKNLTLLTIRHYDQEILDKLTNGKTVMLRQQTGETVQCLMK